MTGAIYVLGLPYTLDIREILNIYVWVFIYRERDLLVWLTQVHPIIINL